MLIVAQITTKVNTQALCYNGLRYIIKTMKCIDAKLKKREDRKVERKSQEAANYVCKVERWRKPTEGEANLEVPIGRRAWGSDPEEYAQRVGMRTASLLRTHDTLGNYRFDPDATREASQKPCLTGLSAYDHDGRMLITEKPAALSTKMMGNLTLVLVNEQAQSGAIPPPRLVTELG